MRTMTMSFQQHHPLHLSVKKRVRSNTVLVIGILVLSSVYPAANALEEIVTSSSSSSVDVTTASSSSSSSSSSLNTAFSTLEEEEAKLRERLGNFEQRVEEVLEVEKEEEKEHDDDLAAAPKTPANNNKPLLPLSKMDYLAFCCAIFGLMIAAGGGIGGGGILVPIYSLLLRLPIKHAISFSSVTILGGAVANVLLNSYKRHPHAPPNSNRGCVDWDLTLLLVPTQIGGTLLGACLHVFLPELSLIVLLLAFLTLTAYKTIDKANKLHQKESLVKNMTCQVEETKRLISNKGMNDENSSNIKNGNTNNGNTNNEASSSANTKAHYDSLETEAFLTEDSDSLETGENGPRIGGGGGVSDNVHCNRSYNRKVYGDIAKLTLLFVVVIGLNILKGRVGTSTKSSLYYNALMLAALLGFVMWVRSGLLYRLNRGGPSLSDIHWDESNTIKYPALVILAGLVAGLFGIGGGMVMGPLMLELGVEPHVAAATSAMMILFTAATASVSYFLYRQLPNDYAAAGLVLGFFATLVGQTCMSVLLHRYQRPSLIAYCIGIVVAVSAVCMTIESVMTLLEA